MPTIAWKNPLGGDWGVAANWNPATVPDAPSDVLVGAAGSYTVRVTDTRAAHSLTLAAAQATLDLRSALAIGTTFACTAGTLRLNTGGVLNGGTLVAGGGALVATGGTLENVAFRGTLDLSAASSTLHLAGTVTFARVDGTGAGTMNLTGENAFLYISLPGASRFALDNLTMNVGAAQSSVSLLLDSGSDPTTVTLGSNLLIAQSASGSFFSMMGFSGDLVVNDGAMRFLAAAGHAYFSGGMFTNNGAISIGNGEGVAFEEHGFINRGNITVGSGGTLAIGQTDLTPGSFWTSTGTITADDASLVLWNSFNRASLQTIHRSGGTITINGDLDNSGGTLQVGAGTALGGIVLRGVIQGGTVQDTGGGLLLKYGSLENLTFRGALDLSAAGSAAILSGADVFVARDGAAAGTINLTGSGSVLDAFDRLVLDRVTVNVGGLGDGSFLVAYPYSTTAELTLGRTTLVSQTGSGTSFQLLADRGGSIVNDGTMVLQALGGHADIAAARFANAGAVVVKNGETLDLSGVVQFANLVGTILSGGRFEAGGGATIRLTDGARIATDNSDLTLSGARARIGSIDRTTGAWTDVDQTVSAVGAAGRLRLLGGRNFTAAGNAGTFSDSGVLTLEGGRFAAARLAIDPTGRLDGFGAVAGTVANSGTIAVAINPASVVPGPRALAFLGAVADDGRIETGDGAVSFAGDVTGAGSVGIVAGGRAVFAAAIAPGVAIDFLGAGGRLDLGAPARGMGTIGGFASGDTIDLLATAVTGATFAGGLLTIRSGAAIVASLHLAGAFVTNSFNLASDGSGGTAITHA